MRTVIIREDNTVTVDMQSYSVDCSDLPTFIHAIHWDGTNGEMEFNADDRGTRHSNVKFIDFAPYEYLVDRWRIKREGAIREAERIEQEGLRVRQEAEEARARKAAEEETVRPTVKPAEKSRRHK